jgi:hypothetical protein
MAAARTLTTALVSPEWRLAFRCRQLTAAASKPIDRSTTAERALDYEMAW